MRLFKRKCIRKKPPLPGKARRSKSVGKSSSNTHSSSSTTGAPSSSARGVPTRIKKHLQLASMPPVERLVLLNGEPEETSLLFPRGWATVSHRSGENIYVHRATGVCTLGWPYLPKPHETEVSHNIPVYAHPGYARGLHYWRDFESSYLFLYGKRRPPKPSEPEAYLAEISAVHQLRSTTEDEDDDKLELISGQSSLNSSADEDIANPDGGEVSHSSKLENCAYVSMLDRDDEQSTDEDLENALLPEDTLQLVENQCLPSTKEDEHSVGFVDYKEGDGSRLIISVSDPDTSTVTQKFLYFSVREEEEAISIEEISPEEMVTPKRTKELNECIQSLRQKDLGKPVTTEYIEEMIDQGIENYDSFLNDPPDGRILVLEISSAEQEDSSDPIGFTEHILHLDRGTGEEYYSAGAQVTEDLEGVEHVEEGGGDEKEEERKEEQEEEEVIKGGEINVAGYEQEAPPKSLKEQLANDIDTLSRMQPTLDDILYNLLLLEREMKEAQKKNDRYQGFRDETAEELLKALFSFLVNALTQTKDDVNTILYLILTLKPKTYETEVWQVVVIGKRLLLIKNCLNKVLTGLTMLRTQYRKIMQTSHITTDLDEEQKEDNPAPLEKPALLDNPVPLEKTVPLKKPVPLCLPVPLDKPAPLKKPVALSLRDCPHFCHTEECTWSPQGTAVDPMPSTSRADVPVSRVCHSFEHWEGNEKQDTANEETSQGRRLTLSEWIQQLKTKAIPMDLMKKCPYIQQELRITEGFAQQERGCEQGCPKPPEQRQASETNTETTRQDSRPQVGRSQGCEQGCLKPPEQRQASETNTETTREDSPPQEYTFIGCTSLRRRDRDMLTHKVIKSLEELLDKFPGCEHQIHRVVNCCGYLEDIINGTLRGETRPSLEAVLERIQPPPEEKTPKKHENCKGKKKFKKVHKKGKKK